MSFLLRGLEFPIHPFLQGLLEFYGLQLHHFTPNSILHIVGYVALCGMHLGCGAHFALWRKYLCIVPCSLAKKLYEVGQPKSAGSMGPNTHQEHLGRIPTSGHPSGFI